MFTTHLQVWKSLSSAEKSGVVKTDEPPPSSGGGVSPGLDMKCELMLEREWREYGE